MVRTQYDPSALRWNYSLRLPIHQPAFIHSFISEIITGASLVAQWERIHLPMQAIRVRSLAGEDPSCLRATKSVCHNYWAWVLEPSFSTGENTAVRSLCMHHDWSVDPTRSNQRKPKRSNEDPAQPKLKKIFKWYITFYPSSWQIKEKLKQDYPELVKTEWKRKLTHCWWESEWKPLHILRKLPSTISTHSNLSFKIYCIEF